jgi:ubiquinone/menaquinone biosynthesis C-methylase UbiE
MDTEEEARDYDAMDHVQVNALFCTDMLTACPHPQRVFDAGTGSALIAIELCRRAPAAQVDAIDLAAHMLALAKRNVAEANLSHRIRLMRLDAKATGLPDSAFDVVMSNSVVHHMAEPVDLLREMWRLLKPGGVLFVRDLLRPDRAETLEGLVLQYASLPLSSSKEERSMHERQRALFAASLHAALTVDEMRAVTGALGLPEDSVRATSDRHWTLTCVKR